MPDPHTFVPTCLSDHLDSAVACTPDRATAVNGSGVAGEEHATLAGGAPYANLIDLFCTASRCPVIVGNRLVYRDDNHLTVDHAAWLAPVLDTHITLAMGTASRRDAQAAFRRGSSMRPAMRSPDDRRFVGTLGGAFWSKIVEGLTPVRLGGGGMSADGTAVV